MSQGTPLQGVAFVWCMDQCHRVLPSRVLPWCLDQCHRVLPSQVLSLCGAWTSVTGYSPPGCCLHLVHGPVSQSTPLQGATFLWCMDQCHRALPSRVLPSCGAWTMSQGTPLQSVAFIWCLDQCHRVLPSRVLPLFGAWTNVTGYSLSLIHI